MPKLQKKTDSNNCFVVSSCLTGQNCKYNGTNNYNATVVQILDNSDFVCVCPEVLGGLPCPRVPAEIVNGVVTTSDGTVVDSAFRDGAQKALEIAKEKGATTAILQPRSPSCGVSEIYNGEFSKTLIPGSGVFASLLRKNGIRILNAFEIRKSEMADLKRIMQIYSIARDFMVMSGNPNQWGPTNWPPQALIENDIQNGNSYVCTYSGRIVGTFYYNFGNDIEPTYRHIEDGTWMDSSNYGVVHRIASDGSVKGVGTFCLLWAYAMSGHLRIDTHGDNSVMQALLEKCGFRRCGTIYVEEDEFPRLAFEKTSQ